MRGRLETITRGRRKFETFSGDGARRLPKSRSSTRNRDPPALVRRKIDAEVPVSMTVAMGGAWLEGFRVRKPGALTRLARCAAAFSVLQLGVSCGGRTDDVPKAAGSAGAAASGDALPAAPDDSCARFQITYSSEACPTPCPPLPCDPASVSRTVSALDTGWCLIGSTAARCFAGLDCALGLDEGLETCLGYVPCSADAECNGAFCVIHPGYSRGECSSGDLGIKCREDDDCQGGRCVAISTSGVRGCSDGSDWRPCNEDDECQSGRCARVVNSFLGLCTSGSADQPCFEDQHCDAGLFCAKTPRRPKSPTELPAGQCSSGLLGAACAADEECESQRCLQAENSTCVAGALGDPCLQPSDCESAYCGPLTNRGRYCVSGELGAACDDELDCKSLRCATFDDPQAPVGSYVSGTCSAGGHGDPCSATEQCDTTFCAPAFPPATQGICSDGGYGEACGSDAQCSSSFCVLYTPQPGQTVRRCETGQLGAPCEHDGNCESGHCAYDPGRGWGECSSA